MNDQDMQEGINHEENHAYRLVGGLAASCWFSELRPERPAGPESECSNFSERKYVAAQCSVGSE